MMRGGRQTDPRGLQKANRQLLLAAELTFEDDVAERLAGLAHQVGELASTRAIDAETIESIGTQLQSLRSDTHTEVRSAIVRAQELLLPYCESARTA